MTRFLALALEFALTAFTFAALLWLIIAAFVVFGGAA